MEVSVTPFSNIKAGRGGEKTALILWTMKKTFSVFPFSCSSVESQALTAQKSGVSKLKISSVQKQNEITVNNFGFSFSFSFGQNLYNGKPVLYSTSPGWGKLCSCWTPNTCLAGASLGFFGHLVVGEALKGSSALCVKSPHTEVLYVLHARTLSLLPEGSSLSQG